MKKAFLSLCLFMGVCAVTAQEKVKEVISDKYDRNSVSYVFVDRNLTHSSDVQQFIANFAISEKFDVNDIATKKIKFDEVAAGQPVADEVVIAAVNEKGLGKDVMSFLFNRKSDGSFDDQVILARGRYNAKDQDVMNMAAAKVKEMDWEWGEPLVNSSYVVIYDIYSTTMYEVKDVKTYTAKVKAHLFKLNVSRETLDDFYANAWDNPTAYEKMNFDMEHICTVDVSGTSVKSKSKHGSIYDACLSAYDEVISKFEKNVDAWMVKMAVVSTKPIAAKIGTKEGVKNGARYQAFSFAEDKNGELKSVKHGMVRATVVSNNSGVATGETEPTYFYQISGFRNIEEGYILRQKNDKKLGAALAIGGSSLPISGSALSGFRAGLDFDYLVHISKRGCITYAMLNAGIDYISGALLGDASIGIGYGLPLSRFFELTPYAMVGYMTEFVQSPVSAYFVEPGIRFAVTFQPWSIYIGAGAQVGMSDFGFGYGPNIKFGIKKTY